MIRSGLKPLTVALLLVTCVASAEIARFSRTIHGTPAPAQQIARNRFLEITKPLARAKSCVMEIVSTATVLRDGREETQLAHGWLYYQPPDRMRWVQQSSESTVTLIRAGDQMLSIAPLLKVHAQDKATRPLVADVQEVLGPIHPALPLLFERMLDDSTMQKFFERFEQAPGDVVSRIPGPCFIGRKVDSITWIYSDNRAYGLPVLIETRPDELRQPTSETAIRWLLDSPIPDTAFAIEIPPLSRMVGKLPPQVVRIPTGVGSAQFEDTRTASAGGRGSLGVAPNFSLPLHNGGNFNLAALRGNVVVLDFFATWCGPCRANMPHTAQLTQGLASQGVVFVPVNVGENVGAVQKFLSETGVTANVAMDTAETVAARYSIRGFPTYVIIDRNGYIRASHAGGSDAVAGELRSAMAR
ncbi:MAG: TlpA family protein disulfide reductase [Candidatus Sumerlaeaceae bacterium]